ILQVPESDLFPSYYVFRVVGNGFLKQMVRLMAGTIWRVGRGKVSLEEHKESLSPVKKKKLAPVAPGHGLYLVRVNYCNFCIYSLLMLNCLIIIITL